MPLMLDAAIGPAFAIVGAMFLAGILLIIALVVLIVKLIIKSRRK